MSEQIIKKLLGEISSLKLEVSNVQLKCKSKILSLELDHDKQKKAVAEVHNAVFLLQQEKLGMRKAVYKLKIRNEMLSRKVSKLKDRVKNLSSNGDDQFSEEEEPEYPDYDEIGQNFFIIGGRNDPLAGSYPVKFNDSDGLEHKSAERYYWYLMADFFGDSKAKEVIRLAETFQQAADAKKAIIGYDEQQWNDVKRTIFMKAQGKKFEECRLARNVLILTQNVYLACSTEDKYFGTGWRKQRPEAMKPLQWDGENNGGQVLMNIRNSLSKTHSWATDEERHEAEHRFYELKRNVWRVSPNKNPKEKGTFYPSRNAMGNKTHEN